MKWPDLAIPIFMIVAIIAPGCAPASVSTQSEQADGGRGARLSSTLVLMSRVEPEALSPKVSLSGSLGANDALRLFNATLVVFDEGHTPYPYLTEALPQLDTPSWRVFPDGRMETTYRLRPNLTWHDGALLSADDFVFAWQVYTQPGLTWFRPLPQRLIEEVAAPDSRTVVIRWKQPYPEAGELAPNDLPALPRHLLDRSFERLEPDAIMAHPYWTMEYVGLGPYRLERWEPGSSIEAVAFDGHVHGPPKIKRVRILFISDPNTVLANLLSGAAHAAIDDSIDFQQGIILKREWAASKGGAVLLEPKELRYIQVQHQPEYANPAAIREASVRKALAHATDKQALIDGLLEGESIIANAMVSPQRSYFAEVEGGITKYPYDLRRSEQLMAEAGFTKGSDGFYMSRTEGRFTPEVRAVAGGREERELAILVDGFRRTGFNAVSKLLSATEVRNNELVATFPTLFTAKASLDSEDTSLSKLSRTKNPTPANRWQGSARGGWYDPEYERLYEVFNTTLDRGERIQSVIQMVKIAAEAAANFPLYYNLNPIAYRAELRGPRQGLKTWNVHEWQWE